MGYKTIKSVKSDKYKYVRKVEHDYKTYWKVSYPDCAWKRYETEREAALAVDRYFINKGKDPVNILRKL